MSALDQKQNSQRLSQSVLIRKADILLGTVSHERTLTLRNSQEDAMPTQLRLFSACGAENFSGLETEVNDWLATKGDHIQPVNSQTTTCAIPNGGKDEGAKRSLSRFGISNHPRKNTGTASGQMSALGHKRTFAVQNVMSAFPQ